MAKKIRDKGAPVDNTTPLNNLRDAEMRARRPQTMGQRIVSLIDAYNRSRNLRKHALKLNMQSLSLLVSDGENPGVVRELLKRERAGLKLKRGGAPGIDPERLLRIARFFGVSATYLKTGQEDFDALNVTAAPFPVGIGQPVISVTGGMGGGGLAAETTVEIGGVSYQADAIRGEVILPDFILTSLSHSARQTSVHWFDVAGDSMEPTLRAGDWIAVNIGDKSVGQGGIFALRDQHGTIVVKRLEYGDKPGRIDIISDNPRQHSKSELVGDITVIGRVIARITKVG